MTAYTGPERRVVDPLDHTKRVWPVHHDGGYGVTDGSTTVKATDVEDAKRRAFVHNYCAGFNVGFADLRNPVAS